MPTFGNESGENGGCCEGVEGSDGCEGRVGRGGESDNFDCLRKNGDRQDDGAGDQEDRGGGGRDMS